MSAATRAIWTGHLRISLRLALREMRGGLKGFYIFLACIALGTAAIGTVNSVAGALPMRLPDRVSSFLPAISASS